ncbi:MAG: alpha-glycosidase [Lachnospiraceae bacterium]|nr:alpha-glycosidase [Lachnospiraceae bacterium]
MRRDCVSHRCGFMDCYGLNRDEVVIQIRTGKDVTGVRLICEDPYVAGCSGQAPWEGKPVRMQMERELEYIYIWRVRLRLEFKRVQYYFELWEGKEKVYFLEDGFYTEERMRMPGRMHQYFRFPWLNELDICRHPAWVEDTVWYQIMPDRFCRGDQGEKRIKVSDWNDRENMSGGDFYGGDLRGIADKLDYIRQLGISGIYFTPIFDAGSNHKYDTRDYKRIDPDFGNEADMKALIQKAHDMGIRVMLDAVFNHCGIEFFAWKDVLDKGKESPYFDWFFVNKTLKKDDFSKTNDGRYYSFAFEPYMPKFNTNNPAVMEYFIDTCKYWVEEWGIDGIRFDVGNEISHAFIKRLRSELKELNPDLFLLGEIWHDAKEWMLGDEYDSVMNYPFVESINDFWVDNGTDGGWEMDAKGLMYRLNYCYTMYKEQTNRVLFNFLDSHDIGRAYSRCGNLDILLQQLVLLLSMPGSPCLYYGTEIAMSGSDGCYNRKTMPWDEIERGCHDEIIEEVKKLIALRKAHSHMKSGEILWKHDRAKERLVHYTKYDEGSGYALEVYLNAMAEDDRDEVPVEVSGAVLYSRNYENGCLRRNGILICSREVMMVNGRAYEIIKLLGHGKGGYSYLAARGEKQFVLKQIHHEPCDYYQFGNKMEAEKRDYERLKRTGIRMPEMIDFDEESERIVKEYIKGPTIYELVRQDEMEDKFLVQVKEMCRKVYEAGLNIDYFPTNFVVQEGEIHYVDYECNDYMEEWNFENWGVKYWSKTEEFQKYAQEHGEK